MNYLELTGKKFAIIAIGNDERGKEEGAVFTGIARWEAGHLYLDREDNQSFQLPDDVLVRIKPVPSEIADILMDSKFYITMSIGPIPEDAAPKDFKQTGLKWPD